ncbi:8807_t:CDS:2, partial [Gigaspora margarita]
MGLHPLMGKLPQPSLEQRAAQTYMIFDIGKLWSPIGLLCNVAEISLLACIHYGGKITAINWNWPYDALLYQVQAQSIEVLLVITFIHLYFTTRRNLHEHESHLPLNTEQDNPEPGDRSEDTILQEPSSEYPLLIFASIVHLLGDSLLCVIRINSDELTRSNDSTNELTCESRVSMNPT